MQILRSRGSVLLTVIGLLALSGVALAESHDGDDTVFNFGYDEDTQTFIWNSTSADESEDETIADVEDCAVEGEDIEYDENGDPVLTEDYPEHCDDFESGDVTGPNGQINHGMFLKWFNENYDGTGNRGCLVRHIAQSDLGMGDQQVTVEEAETDTETESDPEAVMTATFESVQTDCNHGNSEGAANGNSTAAEMANGNGRPDWVPGPPPGVGSGGRP